MRFGYHLPNGWTLRTKYPYADGPTTHVVLQQGDGPEHSYTIDNALLTIDSLAWKHLAQWVTDTTGLTLTEIAATAFRTES